RIARFSRSWTRWPQVAARPPRSSSGASWGETHGHERPARARHAGGSRTARAPADAVVRRRGIAPDLGARRADGDWPVPGTAVRAVDRLGRLPAAGDRDHPDDRAVAAGGQAGPARAAELPRLVPLARAAAGGPGARAECGAAPGAHAVRRHPGNDRPDRPA